MAPREKAPAASRSKRGAAVPFHEAVMSAVRAIPRGQVRSYSQVALYAGRPGAARGVGQELKILTDPKKVPWWRVVRADGTLASSVAHEQARRLRAEGVQVAQRGEVFRVKVER